MGGGTYSHEFYEEAKATRAKTGADVFAYTSSVKTGKVAAECHKEMNPFGVKVREARDSDDHPETVPLFVGLDVTGSMGTVVRAIQENLGTLMTLLVTKGYLPHPAICFAGIGDARCDAAPLQVGQFEADNRIEKWLSELLWLEGGGGAESPMSESYSLGLYFAARHTVHDAFEKRGRKGYLFMIGDEQAYAILRGEVSRVLGDTLQSDISVKEIVEEVKKLYEPFMIIPRDANNGRDPSVHAYWSEVLGAQHVIMLDKAEAVAETIAAAVGLCEGVDLNAVETDLAAAGKSTAMVKVVSDAVSGLASRAGGLAKVSGGATGLSKSTKSAPTTERL